MSEQEAHVLTMRAEAFDRFRRRYRHNPSSQQTMVRALEAFARLSSGGDYKAADYPWELLTDELDVEDLWRSAIGDRSHNTAMKWASAVRVMLTCCRRVGLLTHDELLHGSSFETKNAGRVLLPAGRYLSEKHVDSLLEACMTGGDCNDATRIRDHALLAVLASSGIRSVEITGLNLANITPGEQRVNLTITKGGRPRESWLHPAAVDALSAWLEIRGHEPGPLFLPLSRTGRPLLRYGAKRMFASRELSYHQVWKIVRHRGEQAGLGVVTPHDLRRFMITTLLSNGYDLVLVCRIAGHVRPETTAGYDRRPADAQREAIESLQLRAFNTRRSRTLEGVDLASGAGSFI
ncbi:tyrosine-type recombinase/integrase [Nocardioides sp. T5]|uniref:tyrosine-type recombinase/integrase n=1 Tax=Nocardioides sp. T5 TaxID=3400182 RepID=UPI003A84E097